MPSAIVIAAHSDDQVLGAGGTMAKLSAEGYRVYTFVLSKGEKSHPHLKSRYVARTRAKESKEADMAIGGSGVRFFGLEEGKFDEAIEQTNIVLQLSRAFNRIKPEKVFVHSEDDVHKDHRAASRIGQLVWENAKHKPAVYLYDVWNPWWWKARSEPRVIVDISKHFDRKIQALHCFRSQRVQALWPLLWLVYVRATFHGFVHGMRYAEVFRRIR